MNAGEEEEDEITNRCDNVDDRKEVRLSKIVTVLSKLGYKKVVAMLSRLGYTN